MKRDTLKDSSNHTEKVDFQKKVTDGADIQALFDMAPLPYQSLDENTHIINVNQAWLETFGYTKEEVIGTSFGDYLTPDSAALLKERFCIFLADGEVQHAEFTMIQRDGTRILISVNGKIGYDAHGNFSQTHCILTDITKKRRAEEELAQSERRFRGLFESNIDGIIFTDTFGSIRNINPAFCAMLGYSSEDDLLGKHIKDITPEKWHDIEKNIFRDKVLPHGHCDEFKKEFIHAEGHRIQVATRIWLNRDDKGNPAGYWAITKDITQSLLAEEALKQSERQYRRIVETANEGIIGLDADFRVVFSNQVAEDFLGYPRSELIGKSIYEFFPEDEEQTQSKHFDQLKKGTKRRYEHRFLRKDGAIVWGLFSGTPLMAGDGEFIGSFAMIADITDRKRTEEELLKSERKYRNIFKNTVEGLYQSTPEGRFLNVNPALARILGHDSPEDMIRSITDISTQFYANSSDRTPLIARLTENESIQDYETQLKCKDGTLKWISENARIVTDESGEIVMYAGSIIDITERKTAEDALKLTQFSVDNAPLDIYWCNREGEFVYVNDHACETLLYSRDELLTMGIPDINPNILTEDWPSYWKKRRTCSINSFETHHQRKDGSEFPVGITSHYKEYDGQEYLFIYAYDLSEREQAEETLRRNQNLLNEVERMSLTGGWEVDMITGENHWTDGQYQLHGIDPTNPLANVQQFFEKSVHPEDRASLAQGWSTIISEKIPVEMEYRVIRPDGNAITVLSMGIPDVDENGTVRRVFGSTRDVSMERQAAQELQQSHQRLITILDGIDANIYVSDLEENNVLFMNAHMRKHFGSPSENAKCFMVFRDKQKQCSFCPKPNLLDENGDPVETLISEGYNPLTGRWNLNHDRAIRWLEGKLVHMHMAADITDLKEMEEELKLAMADAESASIAKNEFLANMSHEIRTPLNGLLGMLQLLQLTSLVEEQRNYLDISVNSGRNLLQVLNDILDLSKIESGKLEFEEQEMDLGEVLESVVSVFRHPAESRGIDVSWAIDENLPRHFLADKGRLRQILFNLIGNATKFTESGSVTVKAYPMPLPLKDGREQLYFSVADTGIGIPEDKISKIFDPFTQVDGSAARKYQGTGLGLGIVRRLVALMDGTIAVSSTEGEGTTVVFTLAVHPILTPSEPHNPQSMHTNNTGFSVLVAEDEHVNRIVVQRLLDKLGHDVTCVEDGETAIEILRTRSFDCILTDIQMPGMDGLETTRAIRKTLQLDTPVIALTAHAMKGDRKRFLEAGMDGYVAKPFEIAELQKELERVMAEVKK